MVQWIRFCIPNAGRLVRELNPTCCNWDSACLNEDQGSHVANKQINIFKNENKTRAIFYGLCQVYVSQLLPYSRHPCTWFGLFLTQVPLRDEAWIPSDVQIAISAVAKVHSVRQPKLAFKCASELLNHTKLLILQLRNWRFREMKFLLWIIPLIYPT